MSNTIPQAAIDAAAAVLDPGAFGSDFELIGRQRYRETTPEETRNRLQADAKAFATAALEAAMPHLRVTDLGEQADRVMESQWQAGYVAGKNDAFSGTTSARRIVRIAEEGKNEMTPKKYRKKPVVIEAMQMPTKAEMAARDARNAVRQSNAIYHWIERNTLGSFEPLAHIEGREPWPASGVSIDPRDGRLIIATLEGGHWVNPGDFIIRGTQGEFYPCKPDVFAKTYEVAE